MTDVRFDRTVPILAATSSALATLAGLWLLYLVFFRVPVEDSVGFVQRTPYVELPSALTAYLAFGIVAVCSAGYLWLKDDRLDAISLSAAELGVVFTSAVLVQGPLQAWLSWGEWWVWDARTTSTLLLCLLLWLIYVSYFVIRHSTENAERGKRYAAILGIIGAIDIPLIHMSIQWFRDERPGPGGLGREDLTVAADPEVWRAVLVGTVAFALAFLALLLYRYDVERLRRQVDSIRARQAA